MAKVSIVCQRCHKANSLEQLLLCTAQGESHCRLQCQNCACTQVDAYLCYTCSDSISPAIAHKQRYSCLRCLACPLCKCQLKVYCDSGLYTFRCVFCYWTWAQRCSSEEELQRSCHNAIETALENQRLHLDNLVSKFQSEEGEENIRSDQVSNDRELVAERWETPAILQLGTLGRWMTPFDPYQAIHEMIPNRQCLMPRTSARCSVCGRFLIKPSSALLSSSFDKNALASSLIPKISLNGTTVSFENQSRHTITLKIDSSEIQLKPYERIKNRRESLKSIAEAECHNVVPAPWTSQLFMPELTAASSKKMELTVESYHIETIGLELVFNSSESKAL